MTTTIYIVVLLLTAVASHNRLRKPKGGKHKSFGQAVRADMLGHFKSSFKQLEGQGYFRHLDYDRAVSGFANFIDGQKDFNEWIVKHPDYFGHGDANLLRVNVDAVFNHKISQLASGNAGQVARVDFDNAELNPATSFLGPGYRFEGANALHFPGQDQNQMRQMLYSKFSIPAMKRKLLATGNAYLNFASLRDNYWGDTNGNGRNVLGQLLMEIRASSGGYTAPWFGNWQAGQQHYLRKAPAPPSSFY